MSKAKLLAIAGAFGTLIPIITFFNVPFPIPAWAQDVERLESSQLEKIVDLYSRELHHKKYEHRKLQRDIQQMEKDGEIVPDSYLKDDEFLKGDIENMEKIIDNAHSRILELEKN